MHCRSGCTDSMASESNRAKASPPQNVASFGLTRSHKLLASIRKSGRRILSPVLSNCGPENPNAKMDIVSITIHCQMWHVTNCILSHLDAVSLEMCEDVCQLWRNYIKSEHMWKRVVERRAIAMPDLVQQNGWSKHIPSLGGRLPSNEKCFKEVSTNGDMKSALSKAISATNRLNWVNFVVL